MPLAQLLAPQIAQKLAQIETDLGRQGYLAHSGLAFDGNVGAGAAPQRAPMQPPKMKKGETAATAAQRELRASEAAKKPATVAKLVGEGMTSGARKVETEKNVRRLPYLAPQPVAAAPQMMHGRQVVQLGAGPAGMSEGGQAVDRKGKKLGFLANSGDSNLSFPKSDPMNPYETGSAAIVKRMPGGAAVIDQRYRSALEAMQNNRDEQGMPTDKLPTGYFEAAGRERGKPYSKAEREDVLNGIKALREIDKGVSI